MAQSKPEPKTERTYVVLAGTKNQLATFEAGRVDAASAKAAVAAVADPASPSEVYVAIPARSFSVFEGQVEQPPPVFRFQEVDATVKVTVKETPKIPSPETDEEDELAALTTAGRFALEDDAA